MKKYFKSAVVILLALIMTFTVVACSKPGIVTQQQLDDAVKNGVAKGKVTFTYSPAASSNNDRAAAERFISAFEKKYKDVKVKRDYSQTSDARIASADIGDVFYFAEEATYKYAVTDKALLPLDGFIEKFGIDRSDVYSGVFSLGLVNGRLYFVARDYNQVVMFYNKAAVTEANLSDAVHKDWTWSEFQLLAEQFTNENYYAADLNLPWSPVYTAFFEAYTDRNAWCNTTEKKITFSDAEGKILKAIGEAVELARKDYAKIEGVNNSAPGLSGKEPVFKTVVYPSLLSEAQGYDNKGIEWDVINMPLFERPSFGCGSSGVGVFSRTQNIAASAALALFFFTPEGQRAFNQGTGGSVPLLKSLDVEGFDAWKFPDDENWCDKNWDAFVYLADTASTPGQVKCRMPIEVAEAIDKEVKNILVKDYQNTQDYKDGFAALEKKCNEIWSQLIV